MPKKRQTRLVMPHLRNGLVLAFLLFLSLILGCSKESSPGPAPVNSPPAIEAPAAVTAIADSTFALRLTIEDPDGDELTVSFEGLPGWLAYDEHEQALTGTPSRSDQGASSFAVIVDDGLEQARRELTLTVLVYYSLAEKINAELSTKFQFATTGMLGVSAAVLTPEGQLIAATRGAHSAWSGEALLPGHQYRVASVSKAFTAALVLKLAEEGYFELDDRLFEYIEIPGLDNGIAITIRHLLTHTSGLADHLNDGGFYTGSNWQTRIWEHEDIYSYAVAQGSYFWPGSSYRYSNTGFYILGALIEEATGMELAEAFDQWLLQPLGLEHTFLDDYSSYSQKIDSLAENSRSYDYHLTSVGAAGAIVSTPTDVARFGQAVYGGTYLSESSKAAMATDYGFAVGGDHYGLGTRLWDDNGVVHLGHTGALMDYRSILMYIPEANASIALSTNDPHANWYDLVNGLLVVVANHYR